MRALALALAVAIPAFACDQATVSQSTSPSAPTCAIEVRFDGDGSTAQLIGTGFPADQPATLTIAGPPDPGSPLVLTQADEPAMRTDVRGVLLYRLFPGRENIGTARMTLSAGGCEASTQLELLESRFPPACPAGDPVASGGPASDGYEDLVLADAPIAYWRFEEGAGPLAVATVGQGGAIQGNGVFGQAGAIPGSRALGLDGDGDWVNIIDLELPADFTIEGWISFCDNEISQEDSLFSQDGDFGQNMTFRDGFVFLWSGDFDRGDVVWTEEPFEHARWYHIALTRSGPDVTLHVNGGAVMSAPYDPVVSVGALGYSGFSWTAAQIDEFAIYDHALTPEQLAARVAAAS